MHGEHISAVAAISSDGLKLKKGTVDADYFVDFVRGSLVPNMPFDGTNSKSIAIMDNCSIHHVQAVMVNIFDAAHILLLFLPPYSPDYSPTEETFSYIKSYLKEHGPILQLEYWTIPCL